MRPHRIFAILAIVALATGGVPTFAHAGEVIDGIVATVNGGAILQSQWEDAVRFEAFLDGKRVDAITAANRKATLERLIDQELIAQQIRATDFVVSTAPEIAAKVAELRKQNPAGGSDDAWRSALAAYGLTESDVSDRVRVQVDTLRFIDQRFRPGVQVTRPEIEKYYKDEFLPQLQRAGGREKPLTEVQQQIEELLTQDRMNTLLTAWLVSLRSQSRVAIHSASVSTAGAAQRAAAQEPARVH
jgi:peptidyl-prolyl cis-trans isomerase SurA